MTGKSGPILKDMRCFLCEEHQDLDFIGETEDKVSCVITAADGKEVDALICPKCAKLPDKEARKKRKIQSVSCPCCHRARVFVATIQYKSPITDRINRKEECRVCPDCRWNSAGSKDEGLIDHLLQQAVDVKRTEYEDFRHYFVPRPGATSVWNWLDAALKREMLFAGERGREVLIDIVEQSETYMQNLFDLGNAEASETYFRIRAELTATHRQSSVIQGWCYGLPRMLADFREWKHSAENRFDLEKLKSESWEGYNHELFNLIPRSIKRHLSIAYSHLLALLRDHKDLEEETLRFNRRLWHKESLPATIYEWLDLMSQFKTHGKRFKLCRPMAKALANTDPPSDWKETIKLPFPVTQIELPGLLPDLLPAKNTEELAADTIAYVYRDSREKLRIRFSSKIAGMTGRAKLKDLVDATDPDEQYLARVIANTIFYINSSKANVVKVLAETSSSGREPSQKEKKGPPDEICLLSCRPRCNFPA